MMVTEKLAIDDARRATEEGHGAEDRREHKPDADQGTRDLFHGFAGGFPGRKPFLAHDRSTFSTTTMASSTRRPMDSTMANMVSILMEKPKKPSTAKVPKSTTGTAMVESGLHGCSHEKPHDQENQQDGLKQVLTTSLIATLTKGVVSKG